MHEALCGEKAPIFTFFCPTFCTIWPLDCYRGGGT